MRSVDEWVAKHDDQRVPDRVRLRVFYASGGICHISGRRIMPGEKWELEHVIALANGGEHRERNLAPALVAPHKDKTRADRREQSRVTRIRKRHLGIRKPSRFPGSRDSRWKKRMDGTVVER